MEGFVKASVVLVVAMPRAKTSAEVLMTFMVMTFMVMNDTASRSYSCSYLLVVLNTELVMRVTRIQVFILQVQCQYEFDIAIKIIGKS